MDSGVGGTGFWFLMMISPNGTNWRLFVDDDGTVHTQLVERS